MEVECKADEETNQQINCNQENVSIEDIIRGMLKAAGFVNYESRVVTNLSDYMHGYVNNILEKAVVLMKHAGRDTISAEDAKLAVQEIFEKSPAKRFSTKELLKIAQEQNKDDLPEINGRGLRLPSDEHCLSNSNYKLKSANSKHPVNISMMDVRNNHNQLLTLNTLKGHLGGVPTVICTSSGAMSVNVPMNLASPRLIFKQSNSLNNNM